MAKEKKVNKENAKTAEEINIKDTDNAKEESKKDAGVKQAAADKKKDSKAAAKPAKTKEKATGKKTEDKTAKDNKEKLTPKEKRAARKEEDKKPKKKNIKARLLVAGIIVALLAASVIVLLNIRPAGAGNPLGEAGVPGTPNNLKDKSMNVLICGIDQDEGRLGEEELTDMIMVMNLDRENDKATLLQIPRDTYVGEHVVKYGKINGLYYHGYSDGYKDDEKVRSGIGCLGTTIYNMLKLPIDNYVIITMEGFRVAVDAVGGIEVTMPTTIIMRFDGSEEDIVFEEGKTYVLDGVMADLFVRYRAGYDLGDIDRLNVQRIFLTALMEKMLSLTTMEMVSVVRTIYPYLETDLTVNDIIKLAQEMQELTTEDMTFVRLPGENVPRYGYYAVDVFTLHKMKTAEILNKYMRPHSDPVPETELDILELQNTVDWYDDDGSTMNEYQ
jgi:cell envelope-related function transcriptional attenuator common domain